MMRPALLPAVLVFTAIYAPQEVRADEAGVSEKSILFGQSAAFSGPAADLGKDLRLGIEAAFQEINERGGVHGRKLEMVSLDDAYEPELAIANMRKLIDEQQVFALIGAVGTPTARSSAPVAAHAGVPYIAPFTGAAFLRDAKWWNVINLRASYDQETEEIVDRLTDDLGIERIAILYQDDSFGRAGYHGVQQALERRKMDMVAMGSYVRNTTAVKTALLDLRAGNPDAIVLIGAYKPVAALISWARLMNFNPVFVTISFVGSYALAKELGPAGAGIFVTQVVPFPTDSLTIVSAYRRALAARAPKSSPGFVSLEGYLAGRLAIVGLERSGRDPDREQFIENLRRMEDVDLDGFRLSYGEDDNQGSDAVFLTMIGADGRYRPIRKLSVALEP